MVKGTRRHRMLLGGALLLLAVGAGARVWAPGAPRVTPGARVDSKPEETPRGAALSEVGRGEASPDSTLAGRGSALLTSGSGAGTEDATSAESTPPPPPSSAPLLPTRVTFVDALTGREVPGVRWKEPDPRSSSFVFLPREPRRSGESAYLEVPPAPIVVEPLADWVYLGSRAIPSRRMPRAREGRMTVLLYPEVDVRVEILGPDGRAAERARVSDAFVAGTTIRPVVEERAADGTRRLRGIPFLAGETLHLAAAWTGPPSDRPVELELPPEPSEEYPAALPGWHGQMPERPDATLRALIRLAGPTGLRDHNETDNDFMISDVELQDLEPDPALLGTVRLQLLDREGKPASGVPVACRGVHGTTDDSGRATLEGVHQGSFPFVVRADGWLFPSTPVTVVGRQVSEVVVREILGGDVEILVRDVDGNPVPFAALEVGRPDSQIWYDVDDAGIQRLDPYVDLRGRRLMTHLPPGTLRVRALLATRQGVGEVEVVDRSRRVLTITVAR